MEDICLESQNQLKKIVELNNIVKQAIHDLKSPIAALEVFLRKNLNLNDNDLFFVNNSLKRISSICNDLNETQVSSDFRRKFEIVDIDALFKELKECKSFENFQNNKIILKVYTQELIKSNCFKLGLSETHIFRILSNLINNSIEALNGDGHVMVNAFRIKNSMVFSIVDNGPGFHSSIIDKIGNREISYGKSKENHQGIALYNAFKKVEASGGKIRLPHVSKGATIEIHLPIYGSITKRVAYF